MSYTPGWQPIETAPKDGTAIVALCPTQADRYHRGRSAARVIFFGHTKWLSLPGWWACHPTYWMPLPDLIAKAEGHDPQQREP